MQATLRAANHLQKVYLYRVPSIFEKLSMDSVPLLSLSWGIIHSVVVCMHLPINDAIKSSACSGKITVLSSIIRL
jgi:hypothetical protein